jgi:uncharacterized protein (DUF2147 family)
MKKLLLFSILFISTLTLSAQTPVGVWKTIDDETGEAKSHVQVYEQNGKLYGKVIAFLRKNTDPNRICDKCTDYRKGQKIMNMVILRDMTIKDGFYQTGKILDPEKGKEYSCKMWLEAGKGDVLIVRGFMGVSVLGRTQKWYRVQ